MPFTFSDVLITTATDLALEADDAIADSAAGTVAGNLFSDIAIEEDAATSLGELVGENASNAAIETATTESAVAPAAAQAIQQTALSSFRAAVGKATAGVLGGFILPDGTVGFVPFTSSLIGHTAALAAGLIPPTAIYGFSIGVTATGVITGYNFLSVLNGDEPELPLALQEALKAALSG